MTKATPDLKKRLSDADQQIAKVRDPCKAQLVTINPAIKKDQARAVGR